MWIFKDLKYIFELLKFTDKLLYTLRFKDLESQNLK